MTSELFDEPAQRLAAGPVDLERHEPVCELDDGRVSTERGQRSGGFEAEQAAADDDTVDLPAELRAAVEHPRAQLGDVIDGAVHETSRAGRCP